MQDKVRIHVSTNPFYLTWNKTDQISYQICYWMMFLRDGLTEVERSTTVLLFRI